MTLKATIIGATPPATGSAITPTRLGRLEGSSPTPMASNPISEVTRFAPTSLPGARPNPAPTEKPFMAPTSIAASAPPTMPIKAAPIQAAPVTASVLPGTQRKAIEVTLETLKSRFPGTDPKMLEQTRAVLAGVSPSTMDAVAWLAFGVREQEVVATLVKQRLALMEASSTRAIVQHLTRLQTLLKDVLEALEGGFLKKSAVKVWEAVDGEVHQLEHLLQQACPLLLTTLDDMHRIAAKASEAGEALHANSLAAEYLFDKVDASVGNLLTSRLTALSTSQALVLEQLQSLSLDQQRVQELMTLVQDGVLIQLPSVYSQLAGLSAKPSDTQRFLAAEKLTDIVQFIQRKL